jgi:hypothetical protein
LIKKTNAPNAIKKLLIAINQANYIAKLATEKIKIVLPMKLTTTATFIKNVPTAQRETYVLLLDVSISATVESIILKEEKKTVQLANKGTKNNLKKSKNKKENK